MTFLISSYTFVETTVDSPRPQKLGKTEDDENPYLVSSDPHSL